ncbi:hypothetical protein CMI47_16580 [Candidatus Pacearchaeota archaeon]|jgi:hypothetical protein|nr:hypothetical protein [Candidatus Pacearchaeota archaeon]|tara:strand:- start:2689 stop:2871 length:183 start_codon:yes stop_codon:yes gene_type:complete
MCENHIRLLKLLKSKPYITKSFLMEEGFYEFEYSISYLMSMGIKIKNKKLNNEMRYMIVN